MMETEYGLHGDEEGRDIEGLKEDLSGPVLISPWIQRGLLSAEQGAERAGEEEREREMENMLSQQEKVLGLQTSKVNLILKN